MTGTDLFFLISAVAGGLALFIFGMNIMTDGLRQAAGSGLRTLLARTTRNRFAGILLGTLLGTMIHSSATTVMLVGFVNAGLMTLELSVPPMLGCNIGTTLSMQAISFKLGDYAWFAIALGFLIQMTVPDPKVKNGGRALLGFGLLFLGMTTMSEAIAPHRQSLAPFLTGIDVDTMGGLLTGVLVSAALTGIWQSSGATIAICFALASAGVYTRLDQIFPIVLGAHIGTCATALLGSLGTNIEAKRCAFSHLFFNIANVILALLARPLFLHYISLTSDDLVRQTANLHTGIMVVAALVVLPFAPLHGKLVRAIVRSRHPMPEPSHLDENLLQYPEKSLVAVISELQRVAKTCARSFHLSAHVLLFEYRRQTVQEIKRNEEVINEIKLSLRDYLSAMTRRYLSRRQTIILQHLNRCMTEIERIGDHIDAVCDLSLKRQEVPEAFLDKDSLQQLLALYEEADKVLQLVIASLDPQLEDFQHKAEEILRARDTYVEKSMATKAAFADKVAQHVVTPIAAMFFSEYVAALDRVVRHAKTIALAQKQPDFWIKRKKLHRAMAEAPEHVRPEPADVQDFLDKLQEEDYL